MNRKQTEVFIIEKAKEMFVHYGLRGISMDDISNICGIPKRTLYRFYDDKTALVRAVVNDLIGSHERFFNTCRDMAKNAIDEVIKQNTEPIETWTLIRPRFFNDLENFFSMAWNDIEQYKSKMQKGIVQNLVWGKEEGLYRNDINEIFISDIRLHQLANCLQPQLVATKKWSIHKFMIEFTRLYLHSISTEKGQHLLNMYLKEKKDL